MSVAGDDLVLGDLRSTPGLEALAARAGYADFRPVAGSRILRDGDHGTFAAAGIARDRSGRERVVAVAGRTDAEGRSRATEVVEADPDLDPRPDSTARRALKAAGARVREDALVAAAGAPSLRIAVTRAELEAASSQAPAADAPSAHGRLLALAQREAVVTTWERDPATRTSTASGVKTGRAGIGYLADTFGKGEFRTLEVDVSALSRRLEPEQVAHAVDALAAVRARDGARRERMTAGRTPSPPLAAGRGGQGL